MPSDSTVSVNIASWCLDRHADADPAHIAVVCDDDVAISYGDLRGLTNRVGSALMQMGCSVGTRVLIGLPDSIEFIASFLGATKIGAIAVPVDPFGAVDDYRYYLTDVQPAIAVVHAETFARCAPALLARSVQVVVVGAIEEAGCLTWRDWIGAVPPTCDTYRAAPEDIACCIYTSGSTGQQKAVMHAHRGLMAVSRNVAQETFGMTRDDRVLSVPKLAFSFGLGCGMYFPLSVGATTILNPRRTALADVASVITRCRPTILAGVPSMLGALLKAARAGVSVDLTSVQYVIAAGEPLPSSVYDGFRDMYGIEVLDGLGSTEMLHFMTNRRGRSKSRSCGTPVPGCEVRLVDEGKDVAVGEIGVLWVRGQSEFVGYWGKPDLTSRARPNQWIVTGDTMYRDEHGDYHYCGRGDDMLKIAGLWVSPEQIETVLGRHDGVERAAVTTREDAAGHRQLVAYVVPKADGGADARGLGRHAADNLPPHMIPAAFVIVPALPLTGNGKLNRSALPVPVWNGSN